MLLIMIITLFSGDIKVRMICEGTAFGWYVRSQLYQDLFHVVLLG